MRSCCRKYDFLDGLLHALSWYSDKTNVILGGHLSWPYVLGIVVNFLICLAVFILIVRSLVKNVKKSGGWRLHWSNYYQNRISIVGRLRFWLSVPVALLIIVWATVYFLGYRVVNGLTRYHYFTSQELRTTVTTVTVEETDVGSYKSDYSKVVLFASVSGYNQRINVSNSTKAMARFYRPLEGKTYPALVGVNSNNKIIYIYGILTK